MIRLLIADDHQIFLDGMTALLATVPEVKVSGLVLNGREVLEHLARFPIDVVLMDVNMPELDGISTTELIKKRHPSVKVLVLTMHNSPEFISKLMKAGADGYVLKNIGKTQLLTAIQRLHQGGTYFDEAVALTMKQSQQQTREPQPEEEAELTRRELDVLKLICQGGTTDQIADRLAISFSTVESHKRNLYSKLNVTSSAQLINYAINEGLL